jgi:hypothetical protein
MQRLAACVLIHRRAAKQTNENRDAGRARDPLLRLQWAGNAPLASTAERLPTERNIKIDIAAARASLMLPPPPRRSLSAKGPGCLFDVCISARV